MFYLKLNKYKIFTHLKLWVRVARHNFKWVNISIISFSALGVKLDIYYRKMILQTLTTSTFRSFILFIL